MSGKMLVSFNVSCNEFSGGCLGRSGELEVLCQESRVDGYQSLAD